MAFPITNYSRVWVRGKLVDLAKAAREVTNYGATGPIQFIPTPTKLIDSATGQVINPTPIVVNPAATDGAFAIQLPATDDPDINPVGWNYKVVTPFGEPFYMNVPYNTGVLNSPGDPLHTQQVIELVTIVPDPESNGGQAQIITGQDGRGVSSITVNGSNHLIFTMTDSSTIDAGSVVAGLDAEGVRDTMGTAIVGGTGITSTVNDGADTITIATSALLPTLVDAKGDLLAGTADNTVARRSVGSNGQVLVADSSQTTGLNWMTPDYIFDAPSRHSLIEWNFDPCSATGTNQVLTSGTIYLAKITPQVGGTISNIGLAVTVAGGTLTSGQNLAAIYDSSGNRIALTSDQTTAWGTTGFKSCALTASVSLTAGADYYVAVLSVGTTPITLARGPASLFAPNAGLSNAALRFALNGTSQTSLPSTRTLSSNTSTNALGFWCALS